jgi:hypothetical protein
MITKESQRVDISRRRQTFVAKTLQICQRPPGVVRGNRSTADHPRGSGQFGGSLTAAYNTMDWVTGLPSHPRGYDCPGRIPTASSHCLTRLGLVQCSCPSLRSAVAPLLGLTATRLRGLTDAYG